MEALGFECGYQAVNVEFLRSNYGSIGIFLIRK